MKFVLISACLVALCSLTSGQGGQVYCGRHLADTLAFYCSEAEEDAVKRSDGAMGAASLYGTRGWRWATLGGARGKRGDKGIVEECCYKTCTLDELLTYC